MIYQLYLTYYEKIKNMTNKEAAELIKNLIIKTDGRANGKSIHSAYINAALIKAIESLQGANMVKEGVEND